MHQSRAEEHTMDFNGKVVVITGGGGGIGKAAARRFLDEGASVVLAGTRAAVLEAARDELDPSGGRVEIVAGQITRRGQASDVTNAIAFLAGDGARWITGTTLPVDGGVLAGRSPALQAETAAA